MEYEGCARLLTTYATLLAKSANPICTFAKFNLGLAAAGGSLVLTINSQLKSFKE